MRPAGASSFFLPPPKDMSLTLGPYPTLPMLWALFQQSNKTCERYLAICACAIWQERRLGPLSSSNHGRSLSASHALQTDIKHLPEGLHTNLDTMQLRCSSASALVSQARATRHCRSLVSSPSRFTGTHTHCCLLHGPDSADHYFSTVRMHVLLDDHTHSLSMVAMQASRPAAVRAPSL